MKQFFLTLMLIFGQIIVSSGDELIWNFSNGHDAFTMRIDLGEDKVYLHDKQKNTKFEGKILNGSNIVAYVETLLKRIDKDGSGAPEGFGGGALSIISVSRGDNKITRDLWHVSLPSALRHNEGYAAEEELKEAEKFKNSLDGYLIWDMLHRISEGLRRWEGMSEIRHTIKEREIALNEVYDYDRYLNTMHKASPERADIEKQSKFVWEAIATKSKPRVSEYRKPLYRTFLVSRNDEFAVVRVEYSTWRKQDTVPYDVLEVFRKQGDKWLYWDEIDISLEETYYQYNEYRQPWRCPWCTY